MQVEHQNNSYSNQPTASSGVLNSSNNIHVIIRVRPLTDNYQQNLSAGKNLQYFYQQLTIAISHQPSSNAGIVNSTIINQSFAVQDNFMSCKRCIQEIKERKQIFLPTGGKNPDSFTFDFVGGEDVTQEEIFQVVGKPIVDQCLLGYNGSIFAYGQTGSGKTYTIQGASIQADQNSNEDGSGMQIDSSYFNKLDKNQRGLLPRSFEYLFQQIQKIKNNHNMQSARGKTSARKSLAPGSMNLPRFDENCVDIEFDVKCSFLEIYNENIFDLLDANDKKIQIREDKEQGVYAECCTEEKVTCIQDILTIIAKGTRNRKIASTNMNRESSRSHAVFTAIIKTIQTLSTDEQIIKTARFHIVDLAGSERCKETGAEGQRLKEASMINKSLTTLGSVINELAEISSGTDTKGKSRHIRYRESKLTYLLRDALGGNSKTVMICNVNPHLSALRETKSTLQFAQRAKMIKNSAVVNEENTSYKYWKDKYQKEIGILRSQTLPNPNLDNNITFNMFSEGSAASGFCINCKQNSNMDQQMSKFKDKTQEKLYLDSQKFIKELTLQLKEETEKRNILEAEYAQSSEETQKFINRMKFKDDLRENRLKKLDDLKILISQRIEEGSPQEDEFKILMEQMDMLKQENQYLKDQVHANPLLALKVAKIKELEIKVAELHNIHGGQSSSHLSKIMNDVLEHIDQAIEYLQRNLSASKRDLNLGNIDVEMVEANVFNRSYNLGQSQMNEISFLTVKRDQEVANIKITYEEQLETLKKQLKGEISKNQKLHAFLTQKGSQNTNFNDELLTSTQSFNNLIFNTQGLLNSQRTAAFNQSQYIFNQTQNHILESESENQINSQSNPLLEEMQMLLNDCQQKYQEQIGQISILSNEIENQRTISVDITKKYDQAMIDKIALETVKLQLEDQISYLQQDIEQLSQENQQLYQIKADLEQIQNINEELERNNKGYIEEINNLQQTNDYFANKALPDFEKQIVSLNDKFKSLMDENRSLKELKNKDQNIDELQRQITHLKTQISNKDTQLNQLLVQINKLEQVLTDQKNYIVDQNTKAKQDESKYQELKEELNKYEQEKSEFNELLNEAQKSLQVSEKKINELEARNNQFFKKCSELDQENKILKGDKGSYQQKINTLNNKLQECEQEKSIIHKDLSETKRKYESYKAMSQKQLNQIEILVEELKNFRSSQSDSQNQIDDKVRKIKNENKELKDKLRQKEQILQALEGKVKQWEAQRDKMAQRDTELQRLRSYEKECESLRAQKEIITTANQQLESQYCMIESELKNMKQRYEVLEKENANILNIGDQQKYQHLNYVRGQSNQTIKQLNEANIELKKCKEKIQKLDFKIKEQFNYIQLFGNEVGQKLQINRNMLIKYRPEDNLKQYLSDILEFITQSLTNQRLMLETPNNISFTKQSEEISSSSVADSSSNEDARLQFFGNGNQNILPLNDNQNQQQQPQLQNRTIYLGMMAQQQTQYLGPESANTSMINEDQENQSPATNQLNIQISDQPILQLKKAFKMPASVSNSQFSSNQQNQMQLKSTLLGNSNQQNISISSQQHSAFNKNNFSASKQSKAPWGSNIGTTVQTINRSQINAMGSQGGNNQNQRLTNNNRSNMAGQQNQSMREPSNQRMDIDS